MDNADFDRSLNSQHSQSRFANRLPPPQTNAFAQPGHTRDPTMMIQDDLSSIGACGQGGRETFLEVIAPNIVSQRLANAEAAIVSATASTLSDFEDIFASLSLESRGSFSASPVQLLPSVAVSPMQWLLDNLHNPYPPGPVKCAMERSPELGGQTVNELFTGARQRSGWARLLRDRFNGCRSAATDAAFRALVRDNSHSPLDTELYAAFMAVKPHANLVYSSPSPSALRIALHPSFPSRNTSTTPSLTHSTDSDSDYDAPQASRKRKRSHSELSPDFHQISFLPRKRRL